MQVVLILLCLILAGAVPSAAGPIHAVTDIRGGAPELLYGGVTQNPGGITSVAMLSASPNAPLFSVSASAMGFARPGELSVQTVATAAGIAAAPGALEATASASFQDTLNVAAPGMMGQTGYLHVLWREPSLNGMQQLTSGFRSARACAGECAAPGPMDQWDRGLFGIGSFAFVFGQDLDYSLALFAGTRIAWDAGQQFAYGAVVSSLDVAQILFRFTDASGRVLNAVEWTSAGGLAYALAPVDLVHNPEPGTWLLIAGGLAAVGLRRHLGRAR